MDIPDELADELRQLTERTIRWSRWEEFDTPGLRTDPKRVVAEWQQLGIRLVEAMGDQP
jgi:hypothetical protein